MGATSHSEGRPREMSGFPQRLNRAMRARGKSVADLSAATDRTEHAIRAWLTVARVPGADSLFVVARSLGVSSDWLLAPAGAASGTDDGRGE